ncbi:MAG: Na/Pi symporter [Wenzhouxiangellaceae bacterium]|nr:Na/Pi symporter [Wenzhouxiangellaceae bacterium]
MTHWTAIANFLGGIGLFLLGMRLMTDGLKVAAGGALRELLKAATGNRFRALLFGAGITALVQSSSAVLFATIGFVNAGLLTLGPAVGLIFGANLGTTLTSWIVALVGFKLNLKLFAMPMIALGTGLWLSGSARRAALGQAAIGFGVFFLGLDVLKDAFAGSDQMLDLATLAGDGVLTMLVFAALGIALTLIMQSSSAALAVTLTAASQDVIPLEAAAAMVVGANIGTTSTAVFATLGATAAAKRTAAAHVIFNLIAGTVALLLLPWIVAVAVAIGRMFGAGDLPATLLAIVHTQVNLLGILVVWPLLPRLVRWLETLFSGAEREDLARPRHLDANVLATPRLALDAAWMEIDRLGEMAQTMARTAISREIADIRSTEAEFEQLEALGEKIIDFTSRISSSGDPVIDEALPEVLRTAQYLRAVGEAALDLARQPTPELSPEAQQTMVRIGQAADQALTQISDVDRLDESAAAVIESDFEREYKQCKADLLKRGSRAEIRSSALVRALDRISSFRRMIGQALKATTLAARRPV